ncbi:mitochondrial carrier [Amylostereum chailletii]|nr:mitochondrial carrier [Amylostereum chailletii]
MTSTLSPLTQAVTGALGSASANALAYPLDLTTTRLQTTKSRKLHGLQGAVRVLRDVVQKHGIGALYDGLGSDTASTILSNFLYFYLYTLLRALVLRRVHRHSPVSTVSAAKASTLPPTLSVSQELGLGFLAGVTSRLIATPLSVITVRLQTEREDDEDIVEGTVEKVTSGAAKKESGVAAVMKAIYAQDGIAGFWRGIQSTVILSFNPALTFALLHLFRRITSRISKAPNTATPGPVGSFTGAALANAVAVTFLYPLILAKTRLQIARASSPTFSTDHSTHIPLPPSGLKRPTISSTLIAAYSGQDGFPGGLYQGLSAQIAKGVISMGVTIMVKERIEQGLVQAVRWWR